MLMANLQSDISDVELKQRWRLYWIHTIFEFSNIKWQKSSWIDLKTSSFEECISAYFDILALDDAYKKALQAGNVSDEEVQNAQEFHKLITFYIEPSDNAQEILNDKEWQNIVRAAKDFWHYLKESLTSTRERKLIDDLEKEFPF